MTNKMLTVIILIRTRAFRKNALFVFEAVHSGVRKYLEKEIIL